MGISDAEVDLDEWMTVFSFRYGIPSPHTNSYFLEGARVTITTTLTGCKGEVGFAPPG